MASAGSRKAEANQLGEGIAHIRGSIDRWKENDGKPWGTETGFPSIDAITGGLHPGQLTILGAASSHGKTSLAAQIALNVMTELALSQETNGGKPGKVLFFSPEMTPDQLVTRFACQLSETDSVLIQNGSAPEDEYNDFLRAVERLERHSDLIDIRSTGSGDINTITQTIDNEIDALGNDLSLVVVDYLQRLTGGGGLSRYEKTSELSQKLKDLTNIYRVPLLVLSQLSRRASERGEKGDEDPVPSMDDLRDSGRVGEDADNIILLWNPRNLTNDFGSGTGRTAVLAIEKNRNGPTGRVNLVFIPQYTTFRDLAPHRVLVDGGRK